ncbi:MAG: HRDC domain-containing protein, partial [Silicimonas sp.]|nr:HRDC domain-containing protein [Silicimonas sp.]
LDDMAGITGVGAKKLDRYGSAFLAIISGEIPVPDHPARRKLAGKTAGHIYDRLLAAQARLQRGNDGTGKPMSCSASLLAKVAALGPGTRDQLDRLLGDRLSDRFGDAFQSVLNDA